MPFNEKSRLDTTQVNDRRGRGVGTTVAVGGGGLGLVILLVSLLLGVDLTGLAGPVEQTQATPVVSSGDIGSLSERCRTGADANTRQDCRLVGFVNSIQSFWSAEFTRYKSQYQPAQTVLFSGSTRGACGYASTATGPFYCPTDQMIYVDLVFFEELQTRYGAQGGPFAEAYVLAHEYGHHIQNLTGILEKMGDSRTTGQWSPTVQIELQADCLAGVWAHNATATGYLTPLTDKEIAQSLDAAASVGDDRIQRRTQGYVSPESWTHGSSAQRQQALIAGLKSGDISGCAIK
jgi:uncharacterized protein